MIKFFFKYYFSKINLFNIIFKAFILFLFDKYINLYNILAIF